MKTSTLKTLLVTLPAAALFGCATPTTHSPNLSDLERQLQQRTDENTQLQSSVSTLQEQLSGREQTISEYEQRIQSGQGQSQDTDLLPPNAQAGECYARVFAPPIYETTTQEVLHAEASQQIEVIPAQYNWVEETVLVKEASQEVRVIPAEYGWNEEQLLVKPATTMWKKGRGPIERIDDMTGEIMCRVEVPAEYRTVRKRVLLSEARTETIDIPAEYETFRVKKLFREAEERRIEIPAEYQTVTGTNLVREGYMEWRSILCETNATPDLISSIQRALESKGFAPGPIDGVYGPDTVSAVKAYQQTNGLATGNLTLETVKSLGISI